MAWRLLCYRGHTWPHTPPHPCGVPRRHTEDTPERRRLPRRPRRCDFGKLWYCGSTDSVRDYGGEVPRRGRGQGVAPPPTYPPTQAMAAHRPISLSPHTAIREPNASGGKAARAGRPKTRGVGRWHGRRGLAAPPISRPEAFHVMHTTRRGGRVFHHGTPLPLPKTHLARTIAGPTRASRIFSNSPF